MDTKGQELQNKWQEIENRIQTSRESIEQSNMKAAAANANKAEKPVLVSNVPEMARYRDWEKIGRAHV